MGAYIVSLFVAEAKGAEITEPGSTKPIVKNVYGNYDYVDVGAPGFMQTMLSMVHSDANGASDQCDAIDSGSDGVTRWAFNAPISVMPFFGQATKKIPVNGKVVKQYDACGNQWNYSYDTGNKRTTMTDNKGNQLIHEYDEDYRLIKSIDSSGNASRLSYGPLNKPLTTTNQNDATTTYGYDANGNVAGAYIGIWVILFGYLLAMGNKLSNLRRQVDALTEAVERKDKNENLV